MSGRFTASSRLYSSLPLLLPCLVIVNESGTRSSGCWDQHHAEPASAGAGAAVLTCPVPVMTGWCLALRPSSLQSPGTS